MGRIKFRPDYYIDAYELSKSGMPDSKIAKTLSVKPETFKQWQSTYPALKRALERGRDADQELHTAKFHEYVYKNLSPDLKRLWDQIMRFHREDNGLIKIDALLENKGKQVRQSLFLHALVSTNFNASEALRRLNLSMAVLQSWKKDPRFLALLDEIDWHKKNFFETGLIRKVAEGDTKAIIFANETANRDRGYDRRIRVDVSGKIDHSFTVDIDKLDLSLEVRKALLDAIKEQREKSEEGVVDGNLLSVS